MEAADEREASLQSVLLCKHRRMVKKALHSRTTTPTTGPPGQGCLSTNDHSPEVFAQGPSFSGDASSSLTSTALGSFDLVRKFLEHLMDEDAAATHDAIDWAAVEASTSDCRTLEQAVGRAVVVADQMSRGVFVGVQCAQLWPAYDANDPFFAFSVSDVAPDFGDESRYRQRVVRRFAGLLGVAPRLCPYEKTQSSGKKR
jgi:hypothetical protein